MIEGTFCIWVDINDDRHIGIPHRDLKLPDGKKIAHFNPCVTVKIADLQRVLDEHWAGNQKEVNRILSQYY